MDSFDAREEFWACTLSKNNTSVTFEPSDDKLEIRSACLGEKAKPGERNLIEVQTEDANQKSITCSLLSLKLGMCDHIACKFMFSAPTTISLKMGTGPISLSGQRLFLEPLEGSEDEDSEDEGVELSQGKAVKPVAPEVEVEAKTDKKGKRPLEEEAEAEPPKKKKAEEIKPAEIEPTTKDKVEVVAKADDEDDAEDDDDEVENEDDDDTDEEMPEMVDGEAVEDEEDEDSDDEDEELEEMDSDELDDDDDEDDEDDDDESDEVEEPVPVKAAKKQAVVVNGDAKKTTGKGGPPAKATPGKSTPQPAKKTPMKAEEKSPAKAAEKTPTKVAEKTPAKEEQPSKKGNRTPAGKDDKKSKDNKEKTPGGAKKDNKEKSPGGAKKTVVEMKAFLMKSPNLPKKMDKFKNLLKNNFKITDDKAIAELWEFVEKNKK